MYVKFSLLLLVIVQHIGSYYHTNESGLNSIDYVQAVANESIFEIYDLQAYYDYLLYRYIARNPTLTTDEHDKNNLI
jgi:hypothetical protein